MAREDESLDAVREELLRLLRADDWQITETARRDGYPLLKVAGFMPTDCALVEYVLERLEDETLCRERFHAVELGSGEMAYAMNNVDGRGLYIKMKIERRRTDEVLVLSFHVSKHHKG